MKRLLTLLAASTLIAGAMAAVPILADTGTGTTGITHAIDCFGLLITDPAKHAQECGGPNFAPPAPPTPGGDGSACSTTGEIVPLDPTTGEPMRSDATTMMADNSSSIPVCDAF